MEQLYCYTQHLLKYFQRDLPVTIKADASKHSLGTCLHKNAKPTALAFKSLTDAEARYTSIERGLLAVDYACKCFHTYFYGHSSQ